MNLYIDRFIAKSLKLNISLKFKQYGKEKLQKQLLLGIGLGFLTLMPVLAVNFSYS